MESLGRASYSLLLASWYFRLSIGCIERMHKLSNTVTSGGFSTLGQLSAGHLVTQMQIKFKTEKLASTAAAATSVPVSDDIAVDAYSHLGRCISAK